MFIYMYSPCNALKSTPSTAHWGYRAYGSDGYITSASRCADLWTWRGVVWHRGIWAWRGEVLAASCLTGLIKISFTLNLKLLFIIMSK